MGAQRAGGSSGARPAPTVNARPPAAPARERRPSTSPRSSPACLSQPPSSSGSSPRARAVGLPESGVSFRTATPPSAVTGKVTELAIARATINGRVDPAGSTTSWWFEYGRSPSLGRRTGVGTVQPGASTGVAARLTGLNAGVRYWFKLVAESPGGRSDGKVLSFATAPVPRDPGGRLLRCTIVGTAGPDVLRGTSRRDVICGLGGDDRLSGASGNDVLCRWRRERQARGWARRRSSLRRRRAR